MTHRSFEEVLAGIVRSSKLSPRALSEGECQTATGSRCSLCYALTLEYAVELRLKERALQEFWCSLRFPCGLEPLVASPSGRNYRTTTKRKAFRGSRGVSLGLINPSETGRVRPLSVQQCAIEPLSHAEIIRKIQAILEKPYAVRLAQGLSYVILRGDDKEQTVILSVESMSHDIVRAANTLSKSLTHQFSGIVGLFLYEESRNSRYYLGNRNPRAQPQFKKLFGKPDVFHRVHGRSFLYHALSFSQVNRSLLETIVDTAASLLRPSADAQLFDLYCGYGLFALCLAEKFKTVVAVESSSHSVDSAIANAKRQKTSNVRFLRSTITGKTIERLVTLLHAEDVVLLDPPRSGTDEGVIECIAARTPQRVVHILCEIELIQKEAKRWARSGYAPVRAIPLDMFPGTSTVEIMILFEPK